VTVLSKGMTEGPEATYMARYIRRHFLKKQLRGVAIRGGRYKTHGPPAEFHAFKAALPLRLIDIHKKGKVIFLLFEGNWCIIAKMGMVGWFSKADDKFLHDSDPNVVFQFAGGDDLNFYDFRNFGTLTFTQDNPTIVAQLDAIAPDILDPRVRFPVVYERTEGLVGGKRIEELLMDQTAVMSGVGNIIKSELLYDAQISPKRAAGNITREEWHRIFLSARKVARRVLQNLENDGWNLNSYKALHAVYQRKTDPAGNPVVMYTAKDGRATFWVPAVQK
jgi:formamidopyrimidine-DNA glycosylase